MEWNGIVKYFLKEIYLGSEVMFCIEKGILNCIVFFFGFLIICEI